mmetsp:Transcript_42193/g.40426  ORF Transcript_42193/g.40426 Transcript_42193/m.40426 type:complete len:145 (+) Transcript_42193:546-980(+)
MRVPGEFPSLKKVAGPQVMSQNKYLSIQNQENTSTQRSLPFSQALKNSQLKSKLMKGGMGRNNMTDLTRNLSTSVERYNMSSKPGISQNNKSFVSLKKEGSEFGFAPYNDAKVQNFMAGLNSKENIFKGKDHIKSSGQINKSFM